MDRFRLKNDAKTDLRGRLWIAIQPLLIMYLINYVVGFFSTMAERTDNHDVYVALTVIYAILSFVYGVLYFSLYVGVSRFYLRFIRGENSPWTIIFDGLKNAKQFGQQFLCYLLTGLAIIGGLCLLIVPGIFLALRYSQIAFVFADNPDLNWKAAAKRSAELMDGHYGEYLILIISFFWWWLLIAITLGIAALYVAPYMLCTEARYYKSLCYLKDGDSDAKTGSGNPFSGGFGSDAPFEGNGEQSPFENGSDDNAGNDDVKYPFDIN